MPSRAPWWQMASVKFSSKMDSKVLKSLKAHAEREGRTLSSVLSIAAAEYLERAALRPPFRRAATEVIEDHAELLERLAR